MICLFLRRFFNLQIFILFLLLDYKTMFPFLTDYGGFQIDKHSARNVFSRSSFAEKRVEGIISSTDGFVARHLTIRLNAMLQAVQLPTSISNLNSGLTNVDRNTLTLKGLKRNQQKIIQISLPAAKRCEGGAYP